MIDEERLTICKGAGKTPQEAFASIWELLKYRDDYCLRKVGDEWRIKLYVLPPTMRQMMDFEQRGV